MRLRRQLPEPSRIYVDAVSGKDGHKTLALAHRAHQCRHHSDRSGVLVGPRIGRLADAGATDRRRTGARRSPDLSLLPSRPAGRSSPGGRDGHRRAHDPGLSWPKTADLTATASPTSGVRLTASCRVSCRAARSVACSRSVAPGRRPRRRRHERRPEQRPRTPPNWPRREDGKPDGSRPVGPRRPHLVADAARSLGQMGFPVGTDNSLSFHCIGPSRRRPGR